ncbi:MAG: ABC transporter ATP-binding protein [Clostridia bacterium]|nr:ABC transporter ATP-binding protein [Clostridia bacterium]
MPEIILKNVTKRFDKFVAVDNLNLTIPSNSFITLLGPSGCGKTTTLRMIAGLETPTEGEIIIDGVTVFSSEKGINIPPNKRDVGFLFQNYALWPHMTVYQNIAFGLENLKWDKKRIRARVDELLAMLKIEEFEHRYPSELSGGQQQRVAIARTLAPNPKVLFMDEPLSNLDAKLRTEMRTELKRLHVDTDSTFVYVTHDQLEAMTLSTKVCLMEKGLLQQYAAPLDMYLRPANLFVADFMGSPTMNFLPAKTKKTGETSCELSFCGLTRTFTAGKPLASLPENVVLGIRPEFISIVSDSSIPASVYSTLPAGMETTVKLKLGGEIITSVVFGGIDFPVDSTVYLAFKGSDMLLYDAQSKKLIADGEIK